MLKSILKLDGAQQLSKNDQRRIGGGAICDIAPPGCPCHVSPNDPCLGGSGGGGGGGGSSTGVCLTPFPHQIPCNQNCPDMTAPLCL